MNGKIDLVQAEAIPDLIKADIQGAEMNMLKDITSKIEEFGLSGILNEIQNITFDNNGNIVSKE